MRPLAAVAGCLYHVATGRLHKYQSLMKSLHVVPKLWTIICPIGLWEYFCLQFYLPFILCWFVYAFLILFGVFHIG